MNWVLWGLAAWLGVYLLVFICLMSNKLVDLIFSYIKETAADD